MASKTATICAGQQANGTGDCVAFYNGLIAKDYTGQAYGNGGTAATAANFKSAKARSVLYWSSHGRKTNTTNYEVLGNEWFSVGVQMANWTTSDKIEIAFFASCYAFNRSYYKRGFATIMKQTKLFVVCGYPNTAPAGSSTDTNIVNSFFSYTNSGFGVVQAWKKGNNYVGVESWGAMRYGEISANENFKMPGWGDNSGIDRTKKIYYINQNGATHITPLTTSTTQNIVDDLPSIVYYTASTEKQSGQDSWGIGREMQFKVTTQEKLLEIFELAEQATENTLKEKAVILFQPLFISEVSEDSVGDEQLVGGDLIYQQVYKGIPIERNFMRICADSEGIYDIMNRWKDFSLEKEVYVKRENGIIDLSQVIDKIDNIGEASIDKASLCYVEVSPDCLHLCHKVYLDDGRGFIVDVNDGTIR